MSPYLTRASRTPSVWDHYELFAVVNHHGEQVNKGHYTAFVKHASVGCVRIATRPLIYCALLRLG